MFAWVFAPDKTTGCLWLQLSMISSIPTDIFCFSSFNASSHNPKQTVFTTQRDSELLVTPLNPTAIYVNKWLHTQSSLHTQISYQGTTWQMGYFRSQNMYASTEKYNPVCNMSFLSAGFKLEAYSEHN